MLVLCCVAFIFTYIVIHIIYIIDYFTYLSVCNILQWVDKFRDHSTQEDDDHHYWIDKLPQYRPQHHHARTDGPCRDLGEEAIGNGG